MEDEKLSKNFHRSEFACKGENCCNHSAPVNMLLVKGLQAMRYGIQKPIIITSGFRCRKHNAEIAGAEDSTHTIGDAADIKAEGYTGPQLADLAECVDAFKNGGIGIYPDRIHVDVRQDGPARWKRR
jgi:uncharacterized protein YcbK (DUF882 family)